MLAESDRLRDLSVAMQSVIIDSDWGGDVMQLASVLLSRNYEYDVLGATVTFGNASHDQNLENAGAMLRFLGFDSEISRFPGALAPCGSAFTPCGDDAHGRTGLGDAVMPVSNYHPEKKDTVEFLIESIEREERGTVTLVATGPQSNVAAAIRKAPEVMAKLKEIRIMGGCLSEIPGYRVDEQLRRVGSQMIKRKGNITETAEFNFQQAPADAKTVLESGIPIVLFPMDCTHQLTFSPERENFLRHAFSEDESSLKILVDLLNAPKAIDRAKFEVDPVMHDVHTTVSMVAPDLYQGCCGIVTVDSQGETHFSPKQEGKHWVAQKIVDPDRVFKILVDSLVHLLRDKKRHNEAPS